MAKSIDDVIHQMRQVGIDVPHSVDLRQAFTRYLRWCPGDRKKGGKKSAWARLFEYRSPKNDQVYITGAFGNRGDVYTVEANNADWSPSERAAELEARKAAQKVADAERAKDAESAAEKARRMWDKARPAEQCAQHAYLARKKVSAFGLRIGFNNRLLVPLRDLEGKIQGLQYIAEDGAKLFGTATIKEGRFHVLGDIAAGVPIAFGEGYATCAAGHMATGWPLVTCFDAGNLEAVINAWRKLYPDHQFVILADDDRHLLKRLSERLLQLGVTVSPSELKSLGERVWDLPDGRTVTLKAGWKEDANGGPMRIEGTLASTAVLNNTPKLMRIENAGLANAYRCAKKYKAVVLYPRFADADDPGTDWNDMLCAVGLEATREALLSQFKEPIPTKKRANVAPQGGDGAGGPPDVPADGMSWFERFTLIYGTTTVWDAAVRDIIRLEAMKAAYGKQVDSWLTSSGRRMVPQDHVVFDPTLQAKPPEWVNLFDGLQVEPDPEGDCSLALRHLNFLCGEDHNLLHWLLCWLAYQGVRDDFFEQMLGEMKIPSRHNPRVREWVERTDRRNEALDCTTGALYLSRHLRLHLKKPYEWDAIELRLRQLQIDMPSPDEPAAEDAPPADDQADQAEGPKQAQAPEPKPEHPQVEIPMPAPTPAPQQAAPAAPASPPAQPRRPASSLASSDWSSRL